jgi:hypothetical protein
VFRPPFPCPLGILIWCAVRSLRLFLTQARVALRGTLSAHHSAGQILIYCLLIRRVVTEIRILLAELRCNIRSGKPIPTSKLRMIMRVSRMKAYLRKQPNDLSAKPTAPRISIRLFHLGYQTNANLYAMHDFLKIYLETECFTATRSDVF